MTELQWTDNNMLSHKSKIVRCAPYLFDDFSLLTRYKKCVGEIALSKPLSYTYE